MRSSRTLLVEGPNDKATVTRLQIELRNKNRIKSDNLLIDTGADIPDAKGGNRERVEAMHAKVGGSSKFAALVDREFRDFDLFGVRDLNPVHRVMAVNLFWTRGHSLENYLSESEIVAASLEENFPEHLPEGFRKNLQSAFPSILQICASASLAAVTIGRLDRVQNISELDHWVVKADGSMNIDLALMQAICSTRGVSSTEWATFDAEFKRCLGQLAANNLSLSRWICHGHLAECYVWCAVAAMLRHYGMPSDVAKCVGWVRREALVRVSRGAWCSQCVADVGDHPADFIRWLCG